MKRMAVWIWKERREQRWALVGVSLAVVLITVFPYVVMPEEITPQQLDGLPVIAVLLATLVLGLDLFARETRRGTHALILRTPGAFRAAFPAKGVVFLLGVAITLGIEEAVRHGLTAMTGVPFPTMLRLINDTMQRVDRDMTPEYLFGIRYVLVGSLAALAVGVWHVVGSVVSPRAGVGALFGVLGLAVLAIPIALLFAHHPWWFRLSTHEAFGWLAGVLLSGIAVAAAAWFAGRRFLFPRRRAAMRAGLVGLVLCGLATGATARAIDRWETPDASAPELRIQPYGTLLGTGGRYLYVLTSRGPMEGTFESVDRRRPSDAPSRSSPPTAWTIDLSEGARVEDVHYGAYLMPVPFTGHPSVPVPFVVRVQTSPPKTLGRDAPWTWIETRTNHPAFTATDRAMNAHTIAATREVAKATTSGRDSKGRRVWRLFGSVERDGDENRVSVPPSEVLPGRLWDVGITAPGVLGWTGGGRIPGSDPAAFGLWSIDVETGAAKRIAMPSTASGLTVDWGEFAFSPSRGPVGSRQEFIRASQGQTLDDEHSLRRWSGTRVSGAEFDSGWQLLDHATGVSRPLGGPSLDYDVELVDVGTLLIRDPVDPVATDVGAPTRLTLWKPIANERRLVTSSDASLLSARWIDGLSIIPDGRWTVEVFDAPGFRKGRVAVALFDAKTAILTPLTGWSEASLDPIAMDLDGSLLSIEDGRRVVRYSDAGARRVVVWPK